MSIQLESKLEYYSINIFIYLRIKSFYISTSKCVTLNYNAEHKTK